MRKGVKNQSHLKGGYKTGRSLRLEIHTACGSLQYQNKICPVRITFHLRRMAKDEDHPEFDLDDEGRGVRLSTSHPPPQTRCSQHCQQTCVHRTPFLYKEAVWHAYRDAGGVSGEYIERIRKVVTNATTYVRIGRVCMSYPCESPHLGKKINNKYYIL